MAVYGLAEAIENALHGWRADEIRVDRGTITFNGGPFRRMGTKNILTPVSSGEFRIRRRKDGKVELKLKLRFNSVLFLVTLMVFGFMGPVVSRDPHSSVLGTAFVLGIMWAWMFGMVYLITATQFRKWAKDTLNNHPAELLRTNAFRNNYMPSAAAGLAPFEPHWQPTWLRGIRWGIKLPLLVYSVIAELVLVFGAKTVFWFWVDGNLPAPSRLAAGILVFAMYFVTPILTGRAIDKRNQAIRDRARKKRL